MARIVIALGGNALGNTPLEQQKIVKETAKAIVDILKEGHEVIICHGNGPQVGMINNAFDEAHKTQANIPMMPFPECGAMSQGYIGYHLQNAIVNELKLHHQTQNVVTIVTQVVVDRNDLAFKNPYHFDQTQNVVTIVTQVVVDRNDLAFKNPSKPIGSFYSQAEAEKMAQTNNYVVKEDAGRGWRRVIASPKPQDIIEKDVILHLVKNKTLVIACGGGGIPVIDQNNQFIGTPAVIDKDFAAEKLAELVNADILLILTAVPKVAINFGKPNQQSLDALTLAETEKYISENQFSPGSMLPKVQAALLFVKFEKNKKAIIAELKHALSALKGTNGTIITK